MRNNFEMVEADFDTICSTININFLDEIIINPESDRLELTNRQVNDLYRQNKFGGQIGYRILKKASMQDKSAYKVKDIKPLSNKIRELYEKYFNSNDENERCYLLYLTQDELKNDGAEEDTYVAEFNFEDYVDMIDNS